VGSLQATATRTSAWTEAQGESREEHALVPFPKEYQPPKPSLTIVPQTQKSPEMSILMQKTMIIYK
jgi:hypothetical protein